MRSWHIAEVGAPPISSAFPLGYRRCLNPGVAYSSEKPSCLLPRLQRVPPTGPIILSMPVYLSFLICALSGGSCHDAIPLERASIGLSACQIEGMMITPQWQEQHPGWAVKRIRCSIGNLPRDEDTA